MTTRMDDPTLLGGSFSDAERAQDAFDKLMDEAARGDADLDVAFYGSRGEYIVLVAAESHRAVDWAMRILGEHGAVVEEISRSGFSRIRYQQAPGVGASEQKAGRGHQKVAESVATLLLVALEEQLVEPGDLLALLVASGSRRARAEAQRTERDVSAEDRRRRLAEADAELRAVSERLEAELRAKRPELFDRRGRLRRAALTQRIAEQTGGKKTLSGDELFALEGAADAEASRSVHAP
jgi:hypothetical protein